ncbi:MAG TPA: response regulator [Caulobacteraceae bacterium]|nr:response regulator [Caulobacteraceae bacterium]
MGVDTPGARRMLLVEDEALVAMVTEESLRSLGFDPIVATTASEALDAVVRDGPLMFAMVDVGLPDMRGDALARRLRDCAPSMPIVLASGYDSHELQRGFAGDDRLRVLTKPYSEHQLRATLIELALTPAA